MYEQLADRVRAYLEYQCLELHKERVELNQRHQAMKAEMSHLFLKFEVAHHQVLNKKPIPTAAVKAVQALPRLQRLELDAIKCVQRFHETYEEQGVLESSGEFARRMKKAVHLGGTDQPMSGTAAAQAVLAHEGKAMSVPQITNVILECGLCNFTGRTPIQTMSAYLSKSAKVGGAFVRVEPGSYDLFKTLKKA